MQGPIVVSDVSLQLKLLASLSFRGPPHGNLGQSCDFKVDQQIKEIYRLTREADLALLSA